MSIIPLKRKPRPLRKTFKPSAPFEVEREDLDNGSITYHVVDMRPSSYMTICSSNDDCGRDPFAKHYAEEIARGLNLLTTYNLAKPFPKRKT